MLAYLLVLILCFVMFSTNILVLGMMSSRDQQMMNTFNLIIPMNGLYAVISLSAAISLAMTLFPGLTL